MLLTRKRIIHLHLGGKVIRTTADHFLYIEGKGWVNAGDVANELRDLQTMLNEGRTLQQEAVNAGGDTLWRSCHHKGLGNNCTAGLRKEDEMKKGPREGLLPTVKCRSQAATWLRGAFALGSANHTIQSTSKPWSAHKPANLGRALALCPSAPSGPRSTRHALWPGPLRAFGPMLNRC
jgi:hypothetical protein